MLRALLQDIRPLCRSNRCPFERDGNQQALTVLSLEVASLVLTHELVSVSNGCMMVDCHWVISLIVRGSLSISYHHELKKRLAD